MCQHSDDEGRFWLRLEQDEAARRAKLEAAEFRAVLKTVMKQTSASRAYLAKSGD